MSGTTVMTKAYQASTSSCKVDFLLCIVGMRNGAAKIKRMVLCRKYDIKKGAKSGGQEKHISRNGEIALSELYSMFVGLVLVRIMSVQFASIHWNKE